MEKICDLTPVHAYSESGFVFAAGEVRVTGPALILPEGVFAWPVTSRPDALSADDLAPAVAAAPAIDFILLGTGAQQVFPAPEVRAACADAGLGLEVMATGPACRTLTLLLAEERLFAAALLPAGLAPEGPGAPEAA
jgi:uncharacterized protein